jgi:hypothetical protein
MAHLEGAFQVVKERIGGEDRMKTSAEYREQLGTLTKEAADMELSRRDPGDDWQAQARARLAYEVGMIAGLFKLALYDMAELEREVARLKVEVEA